MDALLGPNGILLAPALLLVSAWLLAALIPESWRPRQLVGSLAETLARKTNRPTRSVMQRYTAGILATLLMLLPAVSLALLIKPLGLYRYGIELLILAWLLPGLALSKQIRELCVCLKNGHKALAQKMLDSWAIRDTDCLSEMGLIKAGIEIQLVQTGYQTLAILFWYWVLGLPAALAAWLLNELVRVWHYDRPQMMPFADFANRLSALMMWPVNVLLTITLSLLPPSRQAWFARMQLSGDWIAQNQQWPLLALSWQLKRQLGGPWQIDGVISRRPRLGPEQLPKIDDLLRTQQLMRQCTVSWLIALLLIGASTAWIMHRLVG